MPSASVTVHIDENLKRQAELLFSDMGLNTSVQGALLNAVPPSLECPKIRLRPFNRFGKPGLQVMPGPP